MLLQVLLANISASIYAYKFTNLVAAPSGTISHSKNIFIKTWRLFTGPDMYKLTYREVPSFPYQSISLTTEDGEQISGWYSTGDSTKGCVVFFHGYTGNKSFLAGEAMRFRQWGYSVLLIDFRGHGASSGHTTFGYKESEEVKAAYAFAEKRGSKKIILYGQSMGAVAIMKATAEGSIKPAACILDMPFASLLDHYKARARIIGFPPQPFATLVTFWTGIENGYNGFKNKPSFYAKKMTCPVLLQWGALDQYVTKKETESIFTNLASTNKRLVVYPTSDHESFLLKQYDAWEKEVSRFINSIN